MDNEWSPMESAPKDGSVFIITDGISTYPAFHNRNSKKWPWAIIDNTNTDEGDDLISFNSFDADAPTGWMPMPLPQPPKELK